MNKMSLDDKNRSLAPLVITMILILLNFGRQAHAQTAPDNWWKNYGGMTHLFPQDETVGSQSFAQMQAQLPALYNDGIRTILIYGPYSAGTQYDGLDAIDWFAPSTQGGTIAQFDSLVNAAHAQGMAVMVFIANEYLNPANAVFSSAQGNPWAASYGYFIWKGVNPAPSQTPPAPFQFWFGNWDSLNVWDEWGPPSTYVTQDLPALNFASSSFQSWCATVPQYWMSQGVDGVIFDAVEGDVNLNWPAVQACMTGPVNAAGDGKNKLVVPEGSAGAPNNNLSQGGSTIWVTSGHFNGLIDYTIAGDHDPFKAALNGNPTPIETALASYRDPIVAAGGVTVTPVQSFADTGMSSAKKLLDVALTTTIGTIPWVSYYSWTSYAWQTVLPAPYSTYFFDLMTVQDDNAALGPAGARKRVPTNADTKYYAYLRTSVDGTENVLCVLNFQNATKSITVNLSRYSFPDQTPLILMDTTGDMNISGPALSGTSYTVSLPAYGFAFYKLAK